MLITISVKIQQKKLPNLKVLKLTLVRNLQEVTQLEIVQHVENNLEIALI